jgi:hypothetical protein
MAIAQVARIATTAQSPESLARVSILLVCPIRFVWSGGVGWHDIRYGRTIVQPINTPRVSPAPKLLDTVRQAIRVRHYSRRTEDAYLSWIRRFIVYHGKRHPRELGEAEVTAFLSNLAARGVSASTQNQALSAILFLYEVVIGRRLAWMNELVRAHVRRGCRWCSRATKSLGYSVICTGRCG